MSNNPYWQLSRMEEKRIVKEKLNKVLKEYDLDIKKMVKDFILDQFKTSKFAQEITKDVTNEVLKNIDIQVNLKRDV
jgi:hypothetical protein